jgi:hypothetical protein
MNRDDLEHLTELVDEWEARARADEASADNHVKHDRLGVSEALYQRSYATWRCVADLRRLIGAP